MRHAYFVPKGRTEKGTKQRPARRGGPCIHGRGAIRKSRRRTAAPECGRKACRTGTGKSTGRQHKNAPAMTGEHSRKQRPPVMTGKRSLKRHEKHPGRQQKRSRTRADKHPGQQAAPPKQQAAPPGGRKAPRTTAEKTRAGRRETPQNQRRRNRPGPVRLRPESSP